MAPPHSVASEQKEALSTANESMLQLLELCKHHLDWTFLAYVSSISSIPMQMLAPLRDLLVCFASALTGSNATMRLRMLASFGSS